MAISVFAEVDFVFQVKKEGLITTGEGGAERLAPGTFIEVKRHARVDLGDHQHPGANQRPVGRLPTAQPLILK